jgi:hypothetical protein
MRKSHSEHFSTAIPQKADVVLRRGDGRFVPQAAVSNRSKTVPVFDHFVGREHPRLLDHLVGTQQKRCRNR